MQAHSRCLRARRVRHGFRRWAAEQGELGPLTPAGLRRLEQLFQEDRVGTLALIRKTLGILAGGRTPADARGGKAGDRTAGRLRQAAPRAATVRARGLPFLLTYPPIPASAWSPAVGASRPSMRSAGYSTVVPTGFSQSSARSSARRFPSTRSPHPASSTACSRWTVPPRRGRYHHDRALQRLRYRRVSVLHIAHALETGAPHYAIHLGDVYYAGTRSEVQALTLTPLRPLLRRSRVFTLNANHEMLSGGHATSSTWPRSAGRPRGAWSRSKRAAISACGRIATR